MFTARFAVIAAVAALSASLAGCTTVNKSPSPVIDAAPVAANPKIQAVGYGAMPTDPGLSTGQKRLMAIRASKLDAYRTLVEQIYGTRITSHSVVNAGTMQHDAFRAYVDAFVRGAKVITVTPIADGSYETVLEVELNSDFRTAANQYGYAMR